MQPTGQISPDGNWMWNGTQWVPNPHRPAPMPPVAAPYESAGGRAFVTQVMLAANMVGFLLLIVWDVLDALYGPSPANAFTFVDAVDALAVLVFYGTLIATIVVFCMWLHRTVRNMPVLGAPDPRFTPGRAVGFCFVPFLNLVNPFWSVLDAWRGADTSRRWLDQGARKLIRASPLLALWWILWLAAGFASRAVFATNGVPGDMFDVAANVTGIAAAVFCILVIRDVTARQDKKNELITSGQLV